MHSNGVQNLTIDAKPIYNIHTESKVIFWVETTNEN